MLEERLLILAVERTNKRLVVAVAENMLHEGHLARVNRLQALANGLVILENGAITEDRVIDLHALQWLVRVCASFEQCLGRLRSSGSQVERIDSECLDCERENASSANHDVVAG